MIWIPRTIGVLTALYGLSALLKPGVIARHGELADPGDRRSGVALLSATIGVRDLVSGAAIMLAPEGGALLAALAARVSFDLGDAAVFGRLPPTPARRRKIAAVALAWAALSALSRSGRAADAGGGDRQRRVRADRGLRRLAPPPGDAV